MKIAARSLCVLILLYNLYLGVGIILMPIMRGVGVGGHWLETYPNTRMLVMLVVAALWAFLLAHSIRLIMFYDFSRRVQFWLSAVFPLFRIPYSCLVIATFPDHIRLLLVLMAVFLTFDVGIALAMRAGTIRTLFKEAEDRRSMKRWAKKNDFRGI
jgi:hypothetical protein